MVVGWSCKLSFLFVYFIDFFFIDYFKCDKGVIISYISFISYIDVVGEVKWSGNVAARGLILMKQFFLCLLIGDTGWKAASHWCASANQRQAIYCNTQHGRLHCENIIVKVLRIRLLVPLDAAPCASSDPGTVPNMDRCSSLGFTPQKQVVYNKLLPYKEHLDAEILEQICEIKENLSKAAILRDIRPGCVHWVAKLSRWGSL